MSQAIVTLQLGNYSNFIGSHFWNLYEKSFNDSNNSIDYDVFFSEGETDRGVRTFTPRVICLDWKENLGVNISDEINENFDGGVKSRKEAIRGSSESVPSYEGRVDVHREEEKAKKRVTMEPKVDYECWNEYLQSRYHPRSLNGLPKLYRGFNRDNFRTFFQGTELVSNCEFRENIQEQTRYFVERCDSLQGFQLICDRNSGFSGVAATWLDHLNDEYGQPVMSVSVGDSIEKTTEALFNDISSLTASNASSIITTPLSLATPMSTWKHMLNVDYKCSSKYQTSAILSLALKSLMDPCVLKQQTYSIRDFNSLVCERSNNLVSLALSVPSLHFADSLCSNLISNTPDELFSTLNPFSSSISAVHSAIGNTYGVSSVQLMTAEHRKHSIYRHCSSVSELMKMYIDQYFHCNKTHLLFNSIQPVSLPEFYPEIFTANIDPRRNRQCSKSVPLLSMAYTGTDDNSQSLLPVYRLAKEALRKNKTSSGILSFTERDSLTEVLEDFRNML